MISKQLNAPTGCSDSGTCDEFPMQTSRRGVLRIADKTRNRFRGTEGIEFLVVGLDDGFMSSDTFAAVFPSSLVALLIWPHLMQNF